MDLITLDFETYYDTKYSLAKITTEEYIRNPLYETIGVAVKQNDGVAEWCSGTHAEIQAFLDKFNMGECSVLAHNTMFDAAILSWVYNIRPKFLVDTLSMARALEVNGKHSLAFLSEKYGLGKKGTEVIQALGKHRADFSSEDISKYAEYCINDVDLTYKLFNKLKTEGTGFPRSEARLINLTLKMYTEPELELDKTLLETHLHTIVKGKEKLLQRSRDELRGENYPLEHIRDEIMSNPQFYALLDDAFYYAGEELKAPPYLHKKSVSTGEQTLALAKTDKDFKELLQHPNEIIKNLAEARVKNKSTLEETRTKRFMDIANRGKLPVPIKYYAAHTGRWGGMDKINMQNLPSRGEDAGFLKKAVIAPEGYSIINTDSSQIEARTLAWLAKQWDLVQSFKDREDVYKIMAAEIYKKDVEDISKSERFIGKSVILGCGYGMGATRFKYLMDTQGVSIGEDEAERIIDVYRDTYPNIKSLWKGVNSCLKQMVENKEVEVGGIKIGEVGNGVVKMDEKESFILPNTLKITYTDIRKDEDGYVYTSRTGDTRIYGAKSVENITQAIARCIIGEQMLQIAKRYKVVMTVHDAVTCVVKDGEVEEALTYIDICMKQPPKWAAALPLDCESGVGKNYKDCG